MITWYAKNSNRVLLQKQQNMNKDNMSIQDILIQSYTP